MQLMIFKETLVADHVPKIKVPIIISHFAHFHFLSRTLTFQKKLRYLLDWKPFKNDEKCFVFHLALFVLKIF